MKALSLLSAIICLAATSFAEPVIINLLPGGKPMPSGKEIKVSLEAVELSETIKNMLSDLEAVTPEMKRDKKEHIIDLPIGVTDERTLRAVARSLDSLKTLQKEKQNTFKPLKALVLTHLSNPTASDILQFLLVANFLDINDLLRPAAAAWVDQDEKESRTAPKTWEWAMQNLNKVLKDVPKELLPLFEDYWKLHHQKLKPTLFPFRAHILGAANNKLYWFDESSVSIFDPKRNKIIETIETEKYRWKRMVMTPSGHKLYIANAGEIILIDSATNRSRELRVNARELCLSGDKLYANPYNGDIKVIDTATDRVISEGQLHLNGRRIVVANHKLYGEIGSKEIAVLDLATNQNAPNIVLTEQIVSLSSAGNKIYVGHYDGKISVIDATTDKVIATLKAGDQPNKMLLVGTILFVANYVSSSISIIDTTLDQIVGEPIATARGPSDMAFQNGKLYVNVLPDIRDYPDKIEYFNVDMPFLEKHLSAYYSK